MSQTIRPLTFLITLADVDQFAYFLTVKFIKEVWMKLNLKCTSPQICCLTILKKSSDQLYSFYSTDNLGQSDAKTFNYSKRQRGMLIPCLSVHINILYNVYSNCLLLSRMHTSESCTLLVNGCVNCALFSVVPNIYLHSCTLTGMTNATKSIAMMA